MIVQSILDSDTPKIRAHIIGAFENQNSPFKDSGQNDKKLKANNQNFFDLTDPSLISNELCKLN